MKTINEKKLLVVDLYNGSYLEHNTGFEEFNFLQNSKDGRYYGYCPPHDGVNISELGAEKDDEYIDGITVVYCAKRNKEDIDREIIGFCLNATVFKEPQSGVGLNREIKVGGEIKPATYSILSDNLYDLRNQKNKFVIKTREYSSYMFRSQRFYGETYPQLDVKIIEYLKAYLESQELNDVYSLEEQVEVQNSQPATDKEIKNALITKPSKTTGSQGAIIQRKSSLAKAALAKAKFTCEVDANHKTFLTTSEVPYMEGHHLIPCTVANSDKIWEKFQKNIDCIENIVCLCPSCHRATHFADWAYKSKMIKELFDKKKEELHNAGIMITLDELLYLYKD